MKALSLTCVVLILMVVTALADDLCEIEIRSHRDAAFLNRLDIQALVEFSNTYVALVDHGTSAKIAESGIQFRVIAGGLSDSEIAIDGRLYRDPTEAIEVLYRKDDLRIVKIPARFKYNTREIGLIPLSSTHLRFLYKEIAEKKISVPADSLLLDSLINLVSADSLAAYVGRLEAFAHRFMGTDSNMAARDWIYGKFESSGYDSLYLDQVPTAGGQSVHNVVACKPGTTNPDHQIIIGGHFDSATELCPGADDNASGTAGTLEIARVLADMDFPVTLIFIAFDAEEEGLWGSEHYAETAYSNGDRIIFMENMDMIGHEDNTDLARAYHGYPASYATLWVNLANQYCGIDGYLSGSTASDHYPFQRLGYPVVFVHEYIFSTHYHKPSDSSVYLNFDYMQRMAGASLATVVSVATAPPPIVNVSVHQPGDGSSLLVQWEPIVDPSLVEYRVVYWRTDTPGLVNHQVVPLSVDSTFITGLDEGYEYTIYVAAYNVEGRSSYSHWLQNGTPLSAPVSPSGLIALPLHHAINLAWRQNNVELDFSHYAIIRDGIQVYTTTDTTFVDTDPALGNEIHQYFVRAVDVDLNASDTAGTEAIQMRAATLEPDRILALNRSSSALNTLVDETETGVFLRDGLAGYNFDYYSDSAATVSPYTDKVRLLDMLDYELLVVGTEGARIDELGCSPSQGGILDTIAYYLSIGGKAVLFGRWGDLGDPDTVTYLINPYVFDNAYDKVFHIDSRVRTSSWPVSGGMNCDMVGSHSLVTGYPTLAWDSVITSHHTSEYPNVQGIPCVTFADLHPGVETIYGYDSYDDGFAESEPVAWKYLGEDYQYIFFDIPLSFFDRAPAITALRQAVNELLDFSTDVDEPVDPDVPGAFALSQNYPNPFNSSTVIEYSLPRDADVTLDVFNILGRKVRTLFDGHQEAGGHVIPWDGTDGSGQPVATGIYLYRLTAGKSTASRKMLLLK